MKITKIKPEYKDDMLKGYKLWYEINQSSCQIAVDVANQPYDTSMEDAEGLFKLFHQKVQAKYVNLINHKTGEHSFKIVQLKSMEIHHMKESPYDLVSFVPIFVCQIEGYHYEVKSQTHFTLPTYPPYGLVKQDDLRVLFKGFRDELVKALNLVQMDVGLFSKSSEHDTDFNNEITMMGYDAKNGVAV